MASKLTLKKYANRRLYDTENSTYVTLSQVADLIRSGRQVEVVDAKSHEDVTAFILTQIIMEEAKNRNGLLPVPLLHLIIQFGDNVLEEFFQKYLTQTIANYLSYKKVADEQFKTWLDLGVNFSAKTQQSMADVNPLQSFYDQFLKPGGKAPGPNPED